LIKYKILLFKNLFIIDILLNLLSKSIKVRVYNLVILHVHNINIKNIGKTLEISIFDNL